MYDLVAGSKCLKTSYVLSKEKAIELFPMLKKDKLCGAIVYYDGQHNDARMNISLAITSARLGATVANHVRVVCDSKNDLAALNHLKKSLFSNLIGESN